MLIIGQAPVSDCRRRLLVLKLSSNLVETLMNGWLL